MNDSKLRTRTATVIIIAAVIAIGLVFGVGFFLGMIPDVPAMVREQLAVAMLKHRADRSSFERFLRMSGADWHRGSAYRQGEAFSAFDLPSRNACTVACDSALQVAFTRRFGICFISGDVVSASFDKRGRLQAWKSDQAVDGC